MAVAALGGGCRVGVAAAGQAAALLQVELHGGRAHRAVERSRSLALGALGVTSLTLGLILLQTQKTSNAPFIFGFFGPDLAVLSCHSLSWWSYLGTTGVNGKIQ